MKEPCWFDLALIIAYAKTRNDPMENPSRAEMEYANEMNKLLLCARFLSDFDLQILLDTVTHAEVIGPILYPTECINGGFERLADQKELLEAFKPAWDYSKKIKERFQS